MYFTSKVEEGTAIATMGTQYGDLKISIVVKEGRVIDLEFDTDTLGAEIMASKEDMFNAILSTVVPRLINDGAL